MSRLPLVALHGFMGSARAFETLEWSCSRPVMALGIPEPVVEPDASLSSTHDDVARRLIATLQRNNVGRFHLLGYSMGGRLAMHMAAMAPDRIVTLVLESAHPGLESEGDRADRCQHDARWAERIRSEWPQVLEAWYNQDVFSSLTPELRRQLIAEKSGMNAELAATTLEALSLGQQRPIWNEIARLNRPVLFISGEMDERYRAVGERLAALPGPTRHLSIKDAGHVVHREQPEAYLAAVESFLSLESSPER